MIKGKLQGQNCENMFFNRYLFDIIFMVQGHFEGHNVNIKVKMQKYNFKTIQIASGEIPLFMCDFHCIIPF